MNIQPYTCIRREVLSFLCFRQGIQQPSGFIALSATLLPARRGSHKVPVIGLMSQNMPSQIEEKMSSHLSSEDNVENFPQLRSYETAMEALSSLITRQKRGEKSNVAGKYEKLERMAMYIKILGLEEQIAGLKIIHVAGTKGKGSTCAFCEAILRECGLRTGLFISPHLVDVRERFRIDGLDISEERFLQYFWDCWDQLKDEVTEDLPMPPLFQFLTVMAFKIFICEKVDVGIIEVGLGGMRDSTNVIKEPVVCGISSLGMDHMESLGDTLAMIASHKAGIFKPHVPAYTVPQLPEATAVLEERAQHLMVPLEVVPPLHSRNLNGRKLSLAGEHQFLNAGLAVALTRCWLQRTGTWQKLFPNDVQEVDLPDAFLRGLSTARLSGRAQIVSDTTAKSDGIPSGELIFYLDGAHSPESIDVCARWFSSAVTEISTSTLSSSLPVLVDDGCRESPQQNGSFHHRKEDVMECSKTPKRILLFNCMEVRNPEILLPQLVGTCASSGIHFAKAVFVPSISIYNKVTSATSVTSTNSLRRDLSWQFSMQRIWERLIHGKDFNPEKAVKTNMVEMLAPHDIIYEDDGHCNLRDGSDSCSVVMPSLPLAIKWLRNSVRENPSFKVQVLVTGSLHLVGDVLKLLRR